MDGLDVGFREMLQVPVLLESAGAKDQWGNIAYSEGVPAYVFIDASNAVYGRGVPESFKESQQAATATVYFDAILAVKISDRVTHLGVQHWVTDLVTYKGETGENLLHVVTVSDQKKG